MSWFAYNNCKCKLHAKFLNANIPDTGAIKSREKLMCDKLGHLANMNDYSSAVDRMLWNSRFLTFLPTRHLIFRNMNRTRNLSKRLQTISSTLTNSLECSVERIPCGCSCWRTNVCVQKMPSLSPSQCTTNHRKPPTAVLPIVLPNDCSLWMDLR